VEDQQQVEMLARLHIDGYQGFVHPAFPLPWVIPPILKRAPIRALFYIYLEYMEELLFDEYAEGLKNVLLVYWFTCV